MKKAVLALALVLALLGGCGGISRDPGGAESSSSQEVTGETVSGIITKVNGNEVTLELVTLEQQQQPRGEDEPQSAAGSEPSGGMEEDRGGQEGGGNRRQGNSGEGGPGGRASGAERPFGGGEMPSMGETPTGGMPSGGGGSQRGYTRTGETALYQIPVGAEVVTLTGTSRNFTSLSTDLLVTITLREDGATPARVQVVQSLS